MFTWSCFHGTEGPSVVPLWRSGPVFFGREGRNHIAEKELDLRKPRVHHPLELPGLRDVGVVML